MKNTINISGSNINSGTIANIIHNNSIASNNVNSENTIASHNSIGSDNSFASGNTIAPSSNPAIEEITGLKKQLDDISSALAQFQKQLEDGRKPKNIPDTLKNFLKKYASDALKKVLGI